MKKSTDKKLAAQQSNLMSAIKLHQQGDLAKAEKRYRRILKTHPQHPDALHYLGVLMHQNGNHEGAIIMIERALAENSNYVDAHNNLGNIYKELGEMANAEKHYRKAVLINDDYVSAHVNLAVVLKELTDYQQALHHSDIAIKLSANNADIYSNRAVIYRKVGDFDAAIDAFKHALLIDEKHVSAYRGLSRIHRMLGQEKEALCVIEKWLEIAPSDPIAQHMFASHSGHISPDRASDGFVIETFNDFASSFDESLKKLQYQAPKLVNNAIADIFGSRSKKIEILDAGCGTGLCGSFLAPYANRLIGVDLSPKMLDKAKATKKYSQLICEELGQYLSSKKSVFDLVVSADTLCYFGELSTIFKHAFMALKSNGYLIFTVEHETGNMNEFVLNTHGRYSHSEAYVRSQLHTAGFEVEAVSFDTLRKERGEPVGGIVVIAVKN